jgi:hypothetical protein
MRLRIRQGYQLFITHVTAQIRITYVKGTFIGMSNVFYAFSC